jgi:DNA repair exonuclease SbcCD nuclease subunit
MILAHLSDLHLGFRAYGRVERGMDTRERDVATAFERAVHELVRLAPDIVVVAGDVFDRPDPPAGAVVAVARGLEALRASLPRTPVLMVAGPRDTPRRPGDPGALAVLDTFPNVEAATGLSRSLLMEDLGIHASLIPYRAAVRHPPALPEPDPRARWNVLVLHATVAAPAHGGVNVDPTEWDYVALGGEHRRRKLGPTAHYCGSLERVALDPWDEAADEKGFMTVDLETGETAFHAIPGRPVAALAPIKVTSGEAEKLQRKVRDVMQEVPGGIAGKVVRLRLDGAEPADLLALQGEQLHGLRQTALHLAVEAGRELRVPAEAWRAVDAPTLLREAVSAELGRDGTLDDGVAEILRTLVPEDVPAVDYPMGLVDALDGEVNRVGRVSTSIPEGLTAVIGGGGRARRSIAELLVDAGLGETPRTSLARLWAGKEAETLDGAVHQAVEAVAEVRGMGVLDAAIGRAGDLGVSAEQEAQGEAPAKDRIRPDQDEVAAEFRSSEQELRELRGDAAEVDGDLEVATMDWLRERQDAETTLVAFRDRARELRGRIRQLQEAGPDAPCPTCGRVLARHHEEVLRELSDDWEAVVQDGRWWRRRWEQLELKPEHLQDLEQRALRLHAAMEASSERLEILRARLGTFDESGRRRLDVPDGDLGNVVRALGRVRAARLARVRDLLLSRASRFLGRISGGRILAVTWSEGRSELQGDEGPLSPLSEEDLASGRIAVRLAAASLVAGGGQVLASLVIEEPFDRLDEESRVRTLVLVRSLLDELPRVILFSRGDAVDARPELFECILEVRDDGGGTGPALRPAAAGSGRLVLRDAVPMTPPAESSG